ncbi:MAG: PD40 domain-containing protein [Acidobacteria bacterium]|nr:PD40 domain-containing protein [Acidobacteriota bacterium]
MSEVSPKTFTFGDFRLDVDEKLLWKCGETVSLPPKVFEVLSLLVENQGRIVSKNQIMDRVWAEAFVEESNLTQSVYMLRRTLGKGRDGENIIETVPRRGFRIAIPITHGETPVCEEPDSDAPAKNRRASFNRLKVAIVVMTILVTTALLALAAVKFLNSATASNAPVENVSFQRLTFTGDIASPVISPDGKSIAFVRDGAIHLQDVSTGSLLRLNIVDQNDFGNLQFSPDGENLFFRNDRRTNAAGDVFQVSRFGGAARAVLENSWSSIGIAPDGKRFSFIRHFPKSGKWALMVKDALTTEERTLVERDSPNSFYHTGFPAWSPDGKSIVIVAQERPTSTIYVVDVETGEAKKQNTPRFVQIEQTVWTAKGDGILIVGREKGRFFQLWRMSLPSGELRRITNDLNIYRHISLSADGKNLIAEQQTFYSHLWVAPADDPENQRQLTTGNLNRDGNAGMAWAPDGSIIFASRVTGDIDLWSVRPSDGLSQQLTRNAGSNNVNPAVSSDGQYIFFESNRSGKRHIWRIGIKGENPTQITFSEKEEEFYPTISADGSWLYYVQRNGNGNFVSRKSLVDGKTETITEQGKFSPNTLLSLSPDGNYLAFHNIADVGDDDAPRRTTELGVVSLREQNRVKIHTLPLLGGTFLWTADGSAYDYVVNTREGGMVQRRTLDEPSEARTVMTIPNTRIFGISWSPDRKQLAIARGKQERDVILLRSFD